MPVRPFSHEPSKRTFTGKAIGIKKKAPTENSSTQRRKRNKSTHMQTTKGFK